mgnify:CR=1 FL=1
MNFLESNAGGPPTGGSHRAGLVVSKKEKKKKKKKIIRRNEISGKPSPGAPIPKPEPIIEAAGGDPADPGFDPQSSLINNFRVRTFH